MRNLALSFVLFAAAGLAQEASQTRTFSFDPAWTKQQMFEFTTAVRAISDIRTLFANTENHTLSLTASSPQIAFVEWFFKALADHASSGQGAVSNALNYASTEGDIAARLVFLVEVKEGAPLNNVAVQVRQATEIRRLFSLNGPRAIIVRGTDEQMKQADQLIRQLDKN